LIRAAAMALLAAVCFRAKGDSLPQVLRAFFICYVAYCLASGFASVPIQAVLAKGIPQDGRELFYRLRRVWAGLAGVVAGLVVAQLLGARAPDFPRNFALLFLAATVCQTATAFFVATLREPVRVSAPSAPALSAMLGGAARALGDPNLRRFLAFRGLLSLSALADPFFVIFAVSELAVEAGTVGWYVVALVGGWLGSSPLWAAVARRGGERTTLQVAALVRLVAPLMALLIPRLVGTDLYRDRVSDERVPAVLLGVGILAIGVAMGGQARANHNYLAEIASQARRSSYAGVTNAVLAVAALAPIAGGIIVERSEFDALFLVAAMVGLVAVFASGAMTDTYVRTRPTAAAWRMRRPTVAAPTGRRR
jgi:hypothetical protein